ncbi:hypothetical protein BD414DRAFT_466245 [Trametes punicea]|nr:hypothetical protein BD414DRAFT_466245 [Trametes punicea]
MPPHRKPRRILATTTFYDKAGAIADGSPQPSPTASTFWEGNARVGVGMNVVDKGTESDDEYTLTGFGEMSTEDAFMLPPSPTQTIKYRYRAYRPKLARLRKHRSSASKGPLKAKASAHRSSVRLNGLSFRTDAAVLKEYVAILNAYLSTPGKSPKRDFQALIQKYRDSAESWRDTNGSAYMTPKRSYAERLGRAAPSSMFAAR